MCSQRDAGEGDDPQYGRVLAVSNPFKILCRKQLSSAVYRFHRVGVIGSVAVLKEVGGIGNTPVEGEMETGLRADNAVELFRQLCDELFDQLACVPASATRQADLFDELAAAIDCGSMHPDIIEQLLAQSVQTTRAHVIVVSRSIVCVIRTHSRAFWPCLLHAAVSLIANARASSPALPRTPSWSRSPSTEMRKKFSRVSWQHCGNREQSCFFRSAVFRFRIASVN